VKVVWNIVDKPPIIIVILLVMRKTLSKFQLFKQDRDNRLKAYYQGLPTGMRSMRAIARLFGVSRSTVLYAVNGRISKKKAK